jgi:hypothetical protein
VASTSHRHSQKENEELTIAAISGGGKTITLVETLQYEHLGVTLTVGGQALEMSAEVGLLTHNILFRGSSDPQWHIPIAVCPDGFDTGMLNILFHLLLLNFPIKHLQPQKAI